MDRVFPIERRLLQLGRPLLRGVTDVPLPEDDVMDAIEDLIGQLRRMRALLTDADTSSVRLVLNPEKMVIKEAQRTFTYLNLYGNATDAVISNRIIPDEVEDHYFAAWKEAQEGYDRVIEEAFSPLTILRAPLFDQEAVGEAMLERVAQAVYGDDDPTQLYFVGQAYEVETLGDEYAMRIHLPFISKGDVELTQSRDELIVQIGNRRRNIFLPRALAQLSVLGAKYEADVLTVRFGQEPALAPQGAP
jgi:arsenite-transporting ATPase